ncbi:cellulase family glycosylhydrolase [Pedosphaera parvula]|uniref:Signal peptide protein n=1 Tax=Pedosphaera parvula (strain Ellin514) TaxID=320771 RepID=B9XM31_PEDPL|nr:cellulase family glycosylhydrolase [Pedosphaera parvula]EEF59159.1 signal peptide protein [Pedosphaera parvula Ellin514]
MNWLWLVTILLLACGCCTERRSGTEQTTQLTESLGRIAVASDGRSFVDAESGRPFHPWGMNYGNAGQLMEDFWDKDWEPIEKDFHDLKAMGANVVRVHLQFGKFMRAPDEPNKEEFKQLVRMLQLAEQTGLYLDITGLACYRPADVPAWYDALDESARWTAQARFWEAVAEVCASHRAVFCYDLINEPFSPGARREPGKWYPGILLGGYDFLQFIALDPAGRKREEIPVEWIRRMTTAIRKHDQSALITVGLLPWSREWHHLSGFVPEKVAPELDFVSVHLYPDSKKSGEALESLRLFAVGKPVVIEETFPLSCGAEELKTFLRASKVFACGWMGHYDGKTLEELNASERAGRITPTQTIYRQWLELFISLKPEFVPMRDNSGK